MYIYMGLESHPQDLSLCICKYCILESENPRYPEHLCCQAFWMRDTQSPLSHTQQHALRLISTVLPNSPGILVSGPGVLSLLSKHHLHTLNANGTNWDFGCSPTPLLCNQNCFIHFCISHAKYCAWHTVDLHEGIEIAP
jgi:hypothetical protein